jgi:uncharacterized protein
VINRLVHLELHTPNSARACAFYTGLLDWQFETIHSRVGSYLALAVGPGIEAGVVEADRVGAVWLPYVEVSDVDAATEEALGLGATVVLASREGPAGWRAVVATQDSGPMAFWQPKR